MMGGSSQRACRIPASGKSLSLRRNIFFYRTKPLPPVLSQLFCNRCVLNEQKEAKTSASRCSSNDRDTKDECCTYGPTPGMVGSPAFASICCRSATSFLLASSGAPTGCGRSRGGRGRARNPRNSACSRDAAQASKSTRSSRSRASRARKVCLSRRRYRVCSARLASFSLVSRAVFVGVSHGFIPLLCLLHSLTTLETPRTPYGNLT